MAVTLNDIAKRVGLAKTTVSTVLNNRSAQVGIADETQKKIHKAAMDLGYRPSFSARSLARGKTLSLGFICGDINNPAVSELASLGMEEAEKRGNHLMISVTKWDYQREMDCLNTLLERRVDGVMITSAALQPGVPQYEHIIRDEFPVVVLDEHCPDTLSSVKNDWMTGMAQAVRLLKSKGHTRIGFLGKENPDKKLYSKLSAFLSVCPQEKVDFCELECSIDIESACRMGRELADRADRPTAVIAYSDYIATGLMLGLHEKGLSIPRDMAVIGIDGTDMGKYLLPPLTSIAVDRRKVVVQAIEMLLEMIDKKKIITKKVYLPTSLVVRAST
ncbi:MAG: LacI family DNA-binding transcriptional regulator [Phycisphaerae bacterium]